MKAKTRKSLLSHFENVQDAVLWPAEMTRLLTQHQAAWGAYDVSAKKALDFLIENFILRPAEFTSPKYRTITRYIRGNPSPYGLALALRRDSYLCHQSALELHGLVRSCSTIYANQEQEPKPDGGDLTQANIRVAFKSRQRTTNFRFTYNGNEYVLISGKSTDRAGVIKQNAGTREIVEATDLERTLIDIVVRPAYAGGIQQVADVYRLSVGRINVDHILELLMALDYLYPYQQSIGFLLERAGCPQQDLLKLEQRKSKFDFFLDYGMKEPAYNERWQLFYPAALR